MISVTIFVQTYNLEKYIEECIQSVLNLKGGYDLEVLVVDDASCDGTVDIIKSFKDSRIKLIVNKYNKGCIETANIGYSKARGKYCARLDGDDRYRPEFLEMVIPVFEENQNVGVIYGDIAMVDSLGNISSSQGCIAKQRDGRPNICNELIPLLVKNYLPAPSTIGRINIWKKLVPIPQCLHYLDYYMTTQAAHICDFAFIDHVLADYRIHSGNQHSKMILDKTGETSTFEMLQMAFFRPEYYKIKLKWKKTILATHYLSYADNYFGVGMVSDARRCYWHSFIRKPTNFINLGNLRRTTGSLIGLDNYNFIKKCLK